MQLLKRPHPLIPRPTTATSNAMSAAAVNKLYRAKADKQTKLKGTNSKYLEFFESANVEQRLSWENRIWRVLSAKAVEYGIVPEDHLNDYGLIPEEHWQELHDEAMSVYEVVGSFDAEFLAPTWQEVARDAESDRFGYYFPTHRYWKVAFEVPPAVREAVPRLAHV
ncbi:hypothetical protein BU16DRAFT_32551 [Lophium mytilinum]|uniref:Uncharacterized protein n=1 Tax=Lophium mytilinum TaxID=390894 RepID=A0A6A6RFE6_9PEZI|nr:hypothetical protein BU16DRAFT_32551 [Lophium mytilinum]